MALLLTLLLTAQSLSAPGVSGVIRDPSGQVVPGATVIARFVNGSEQQTVSGPDGRFALPLAAPGEVVLVVRAPSFSELKRTLPAGATTEIDVVLSPPSLSETVTVTASRMEQRLGDVPASVNVLERRKTSAARRPWSPTMCCGRSRRSACSGAPAAWRRIRRRRACRCAASARAASAARSCCSTACRSTIRSAAGCTGRACRSRAPIASRSSTARARASTATTRWAASSTSMTSRGDAPDGRRQGAVRQPRQPQGRLPRQRRLGQARRGARRRRVFDRRLSDRRRGQPGGVAERGLVDNNATVDFRNFNVKARVRRDGQRAGVHPRRVLPRGARQRQGEHHRRHRREANDTSWTQRERRRPRGCRMRASCRRRPVHRLRDVPQQLPRGAGGRRRRAASAA